MSTRTIINSVERKSILFIGDLFLIGFSLNNFVNRAIDYQDEYNFSTKVSLFVFGIILYFMIAYVLDLYNLDKNPKSLTYSILRVFSIVFLFTIFQFATATIIFDFPFWRLHLFIFMIFCPIQLVLWRLLFNYVFKFVPTTKSVLYLYDESTSESLDKNIAHINGIGRETYYKVVASKLNKDSVIAQDDINEEVVNSIDSWIINTRDYTHFSNILESKMVDSILSGKEVLTYTSFYENTYEALPVESNNDSIYEILQLKNGKIRYLQTIVNFNFNFFLTLITGFIFFLVVPFVFVANLFLNRGPLFYTQLRVGKYGKEYKIYKFRSMVVDAENKGAKMATKNDARVTKFGKVLRKFRIDELPQILSVIKGDMVFIGPRPERKVFVEKLNEVTPFYNVRHLVKPGITGWAQVKYKYGETLQDSIKKLEYDLYYIKNKSIVLDIRIIFKTLTTILFSRGL